MQKSRGFGRSTFEKWRGGRRVWRDFSDETGRVQIHVQKIKHRGIGKLRYCELTYDSLTGIYADLPMLPEAF